MNFDVRAHEPDDCGIKVTVDVAGQSQYVFWIKKEWNQKKLPEGAQLTRLILHNVYWYASQLVLHKDVDWFDVINVRWV